NYVDQRLTNDTRQPNKNKRRQTSSNATLIIRFFRLFRRRRTAHNGLVGGSVIPTLLYSSMLSIPTQRQNVSECALRTFVFMTPLNQRVTGSSPVAPTNQFNNLANICMRTECVVCTRFADFVL